MIKKIKFELSIILFLILNIIISSLLDIKLYEKINSFDFSLNSNYLKSFFIDITEVGNSFWFFLIFFIGYILCFCISKIADKNYLKKIKNIFLFFISSLIITGIITQIIKHLIGRPRPNHANLTDSYGINLFNLESAFHSFPSGHTSTIFIVAIVLGLITPKIKYFYLFFATLVGFSRVVVGAHYISDVVGGVAVSFIALKLTVLLFDKYKKEKISLNINKLNSNIFFLSLIIFFVSIIFLTVGGSIDLYVGNLFYKGNQVFSLQSFIYITIIEREFFLPFVIFYILIIPLISLYLPINKIYFGLKFSFKKIIFLWLSFTFNLIVFVNILLKGFWGRARPNDIVELGGQEVFTPWFKISEGCNSNCSFVSGDASVGFSIIGLFFLTNNKNFLWLAIFSGFFLGLIRILEGGHFLSDIVMAGFLIFVLTYFHSKFYKKILNNDL